jgi:AcrR family transcriptional regulator
MVQQRADRIVDAALALAEERGWENVRLYLVAERLGIGLDDIGREFRDLDGIANAWFRRARRQLPRLPAAGLIGRPPPERLHAAMTTWFDALAPHHAVTAQMLDAKLYPSHPHHWAPMIFDLSRLMHDFLDVARIASTGRRRQLAEVGLTVIFLATLRDWRREPGRARERLGRRLAGADRWLARLG